MPLRRREFGVLAGSNLAVAAATSLAQAQTAMAAANPLDPSLTPLGAERAGNADGSIPAWSGGLTAPALPPSQKVGVKIFADEAPLRSIGPEDLAREAALLSPGTQAMMQKFGMKLRQYQTRRTAAAPQYMYDNTAQNLGRAQLVTNTGPCGFTGAYGGVPFPVIDTANPLTGGAQLIWNHLTSWQGYAGSSSFVPVFVMAGGRLDLSSAALIRFEYPFYDPNGSLSSHESGLDFDGYVSKMHFYYKMPSSLLGWERLIWHSTNNAAHPNISWALQAGQGRVRKVVPPGEDFALFNPAAAGIAGFDEMGCFDGSPASYDWHYIGKQEMLVPYNCNAMYFCDAETLLQPHYPNPDIVRWEKHRVWVVEAVLRPGQQSPLARRRFYIDEDSWSALLGEGFDADDALIKYYAVYNQCVPSIPAMRRAGSLALDLRSGDYVYAGELPYAGQVPETLMEPQPAGSMAGPSMAAICAF